MIYKKRNKVVIFSIIIITGFLFRNSISTRPYHELKDFFPSKNIDLNGWKARKGRISGAEKPSFDDTSWTDANTQFRWYGNETDYWFRKTVRIPEEMNGRAVYFETAIDSEGEIYLNGKYMGKFELLKRILLTPKAISGETFFISIKGRADTVFGIFLSASLIDMDTELASIQSTIDLLSSKREEAKLVLDEKWNYMHHGLLAFGAPIIYWKSITLPSQISEYKIGGVRISLDLKVSNDSDIFVNKKQIKYSREKGKIILTNDAKPGQKFLVYVKVKHYDDHIRLKKAVISVDDVITDFGKIESDLSDAIKLMERLPELKTLMFDSVRNTSDYAKKLSLIKSIPNIKKKFIKMKKKLANINRIYSRFPLHTKGPYLQNVKRNSIVIMWETNVPADTRVYYGKNFKYSKSYYNKKKVTLHEVRLTGLEAQTKYHYRVQSGKTASEENEFRTAVYRNTPFKFAVWGDNQTNHIIFERIINEIIQKKPDFAISVGDIVTNGRNYYEWDKEFFQPARNLIKNISFFVAIGNHEYRDADDSRVVPLFEKYISQPGNEYWFSFNYGNSHFIILDPNKYIELDIPPESRQYKWLIKDLESQSSKLAEWRFVFFHQPVFSEGWSGDYYDGEMLLRKHLVPLFEKYKVTMIFSGHTHDYEYGRWPIKTGPIYIITGGAGGNLDDIKYREWDQIQKIQFDYHYCIIEVNGNKLNFKAIGLNGRTIDSHTLVN